jgi:pilus assembly protein CpaC
VLLLGPNEVYLLGKTIGSTNVVMMDRSGTCTAFDVVVGMDTTALQEAIRRLLPDEKDINVSAAFDSVVLKGSVSDGEALARITELTNAYLRGGEGGGSGGAARNPRIVNMLDVDAPQQVMLEVKVAEVSKKLLDQFGIDFSRAYSPGNGSMIRFLSGVFGGASAVAGQIAGTNGGVPLSSVGTVVGGTVPGSIGAGGNVTVDISNGIPKYTTTFGTVPGRNLSNLNLNMQKADGLVKILAEPSVMAISGQTGSFLAGGKIFIPVATANQGSGTTTTLEEREFGVSVRFTPTVLGSGRINLHVRPEVSELNAAGVTVTGIAGNAVLPSFTSRKAETTVQLLDGQSFAIGGLIKNNTTTNVTAFPFLGEIPVLGALFRSTEFQTDRSELVFVITPHLVKPLPADYRLPTDNYLPPTRKELILDGKLEGKATDARVPASSASAPAGGGFDMQPKGVKK